MNIGYVITFAGLTLIFSIAVPLGCKEDRWAVGLGTFLTMVLLGVVIFMSASLLRG